MAEAPPETSVKVAIPSSADFHFIFVSLNLEAEKAQRDLMVAVGAEFNVPEQAFRHTLRPQGSRSSLGLGAMPVGAVAGRGLRPEVPVPLAGPLSENVCELPVGSSGNGPSSGLI